MKRVLKRLTSSMLLAAMVGTLLVTNTAPAAGSEVGTDSVVETDSAAHCRLLTLAEMEAAYGAGFWTDLVLIVDIGCGATGALGVFKKVHPAAIGFCAGWVIGRMISS